MSPSIRLSGSVMKYSVDGCGVHQHVTWACNQCSQGDEENEELSLPLPVYRTQVLLNGLSNTTPSHACETWDLRKLHTCD